MPGYITTKGQLLMSVLRERKQTKIPGKSNCNKKRYGPVHAQGGFKAWV